MRLHEMKCLPRIAFYLPLRPRWKAAYDLGRYFKRHLSVRFAPVGMLPIPFGAVSMLHLGVDGQKLSIGIKRMAHSRHGPDEWRIEIDPLEYVVTKSVAEKYLGVLRKVSDSLQTLLIHTPEITQLRWFFEDWDLMQHGVATPAELPWPDENNVGN